MAKKKTSKRSGKRGGASSKQGESRLRAFMSDRQRVTQTLSVALTVLLIGGATAGWVFGRPALIELAQPDGDAVIDVRFAGAGDDTGGAPVWLPEGSRADLVSRVRIAMEEGGRSAFDGARTDAARGALLASGWFDRVSVRADASSRVVVDAVWRAPAVAVRPTGSGTDFVVSREARLLDLVYSPDGSGLRVVLNPSNDPPGQTGEIWIGGDVQAAIELLEALGDASWIEQVAAIDVGGFARSTGLVIVTTHGGRVVWGAPPSEFVPGEPSVEEKRLAIDEILAMPESEGRIDAGRSRIDVRTGEILIDETVGGRGGA